jgi:5'-nucleotidase
MGGDFVNHEPNTEGTDIHALENNYVSIVPVHFDMTAHKTIKDLKRWKL